MYIIKIWMMNIRTLALEIENVESYMNSLWEEKKKERKLEYVSNLFLE